MDDGQNSAALRDEIAVLRQRVGELEAQARHSDQTTAALQRSEERFATLFRASPVAVVISTAEGRYLDINERFAAITGYTREEVVGRTSRELQIWAQPEERVRIGHLLSTYGVVRDTELTFYTRLHEIRTVLASLALIDIDGTPCVLTMCHDITDRKQAAHERERLLAEATEAVQLRDEFLSIAAHELRTPLTALHLHIESMERTIRRSEPGAVTNERLLRKLETAGQQTDRLAKLINDLLDVTRIRAGRLEVHLEAVDLTEIVRGVVSRLSDQFARAGCTIRLYANAPCLVVADRSRLDQIVTNLLSNAIKYGPHAPIDVRVEPDPATARLIVRDHGIGIAPEQQVRIFERFERAVSAEHYGGLGLGLYIVRQIVMALGGTITVESDVGAGACFTVTLQRYGAGPALPPTPTDD